MARPREFDVGQALERAMEVFWAKGYEATSLHDLVGAMGLSRSSFYDTFGSKHELYLSALDRYIKTAGERGALALIDRADSAKAGIAAVFDHYIDQMVGQDERRGCFVVNCAVELAPHDPAAAARCRAGIARTEDAFYRAVRRGQESGEIRADRDARALARYLASNLNGLLVMAKADPDRAALEDVVRLALSVLD